MRVLPFAFLGALAAAGLAQASAVVGETEWVAPPAAPVVALDGVKQSYRLPDSIPFPPDNPYTPEKVWLGRMLFYDTRLSRAGTLACATCHNPGFGFGDGAAAGADRTANPLGRRSPTIVDSAWGVLFMWDGSAASLEAQALGPIQAPSEMNQSLEGLTLRLEGIADYRALFAAAFPRPAITPAHVAAALATFERTVVAASSPFDAWLDGDESAIGEPAKRGFALFNGRAGCASCHGGAMFTDDGFHDIGLPDQAPGVDAGRGRLQPDILKMQHAFKTPGLREVALRAPYMHDGSLPTLEAVVAHYNGGGAARPSKSELIAPLGLSAVEQSELVAFLRTLSGTARADLAPALPR